MTAYKSLKPLVRKRKTQCHTTTVLLIKALRLSDKIFVTSERLMEQLRQKEQAP
ncbi:hypothetical protein [Streptococcus equi]|uniref:hypothetical protein n=1 Tax=Streptococcus equi TaxID=1336 RepID=UPI001558BA06|nr:hypothetical protein [Streptococcus equi]